MQILPQSCLSFLPSVKLFAKRCLKLFFYMSIIFRSCFWSVLCGEAEYCAVLSWMFWVHFSPASCKHTCLIYRRDMPRICLWTCVNLHQIIRVEWNVYMLLKRKRSLCDINMYRQETFWQNILTKSICQKMRCWKKYINFKQIPWWSEWAETINTGTFKKIYQC